MTVGSQLSTTRSQASDVFTDINSLQSIRQLGNDDKNAALMKVAQQFESMFMNMMMSSMRQANSVFTEDSMFSSPEMDFYQGMYDNQMALELSGTSNGAGSGSGGTGLAEVIYRQLQQNYGDIDNSARSIDPSTLRDRRVASVAMNRAPDPAMNQAINKVDEVLQQQALDASLEATTDTTAATASQAPAERLASVNSSAVTGSANDGILSETAYSAASGSGGKGQQFASAEAFVAALYPHAVTVAEELDVDPRAIVAQAALETGWGKHMISSDDGQNSFNFFGIKADSRWQGESVNVMTHEYRQGVRVNEVASFRSYASLEEGLRDYADFLSNSERYQQAVGQGLGADDYGYALQQAGYATDPEYGAKIERIARSQAVTDAAQQHAGSGSSETKTSATNSSKTSEAPSAMGSRE